jgi:cell wall-associated NlpC family hydrolase
MIPDWVQKYIGLEFEDYNCWQLVALIYKREFNIEIPTYEDEYKNALDRDAIAEIYARELQVWVKTDEPKVPDVVVCRVKGQPWHAGTMVTPGIMLHTQRHLNAIIEHYDRFTWKNRIIGFYRYYG